MSHQYEHHLLPVLGHHRFLPEAATLQALVGGLVARGWVDSGVTGHCLLPDGVFRKRRRVSIPEVGQAVAEELRSSGTVVLTLQVGPASALPQDKLFWERGAGTPLDVSVCQGVEMVLANRVSDIRSLETGGELCCGNCGSELLAGLEASSPPIGDQSPPALEGVMDQCPGCSRPLEYLAMSAACRSPVDGSRQPEVPPLFRFAMVLTSDAGPDFPALSDPTLLGVLREVTGVDFRAVGRYR